MKKRSLFWKITGRVFLAAVALVAIGLLVIEEENVRAKWLWERYRHAAEARGERFDLAAFAAPAVPDEQNFYMTPLLKPVLSDTNATGAIRKQLLRFDPQGGEHWPQTAGWVEENFLDQKKWTEYLGTSLLLALQAIDSELDEISQTSRRPFAQLPVSPEGWPSIRLYLPLRWSVQIFVLRATARLDGGQPGLALEDVETLFGITRAVGEPPTLHAWMMQAAMTSADLQPVWEGFARHSWDEGQLARLQKILERLDLISGGLRAMNGERALGVTLGRRQFAGPWELANCVYYQNILALSHFYDEQLYPLLDPAVRVLSPKAVPSPVPEVEDKMPLWRQHHPYTVLFELSVPPIAAALKKVAYAQTSLDEARIGCALERYRLANGAYPEKLAALVPRYMEGLPWDIITGQPLRYERTADGLFLLYSVGWNGVDDYGAMPSDKGCRDLAQGDWVWRYPAAQP